MNLQLAGLNVLVTGGTAGIGAAIVKQFAEEGANVAFCSRSQGNVDRMLAELEAFPIEAKGKALDVTSEQDFASWLGELGTIDIFIPNVSAISGDWNDSIAIDIQATLQNTQAVIPFLQKSDNAAITYIGSKASTFATPGIAAYGATKAAMSHYMKSQSKRLVKKGIRVNTISPGDTFVEGGFWGKIKSNNPDAYENTLKANPLGRLCTPEEVASVVVFLSSPVASYVTGANLLVDGGSTDHIQG